MKSSQVALLVAYAIGLSVGQVLFKFAAMQLSLDRQTKPIWLAVVGNWPLVAALTLYVGLTALWVHMLTVVPLSRAYPFIAVTLVMTPLLAWALFDEPLGVRYFMGLGAIVAGLILISGAGARP